MALRSVNCHVKSTARAYLAACTFCFDNNHKDNTLDSGDTIDDAMLALLVHLHELEGE